MAAGLGFKTFTTGEVLTAANVNGYLMQGVWVFADAAARTAAVTSPQEGNTSFLKDTNALEIYDGAAWVAYGAGDITGVTAGTGISGGGTSGAVTITNSMATEITAAGDIIVGTGSGTFDNLPIGTTGQVLTADTTVSPYKVKWASASSSYPFADWTPVWKQGATTITHTVTRARYVQIDKFVFAMFSLAATGAGTANAKVNVTFPVTSKARYAANGIGSLYDASAAALYPFQLYSPSTDSTTLTQFTTLNDTAGYELGLTGSPFSAAIASGDVIAAWFCLEAN